MDTILTELAVSISDFKKNPSKVLREAGTEPVAVLSHNKAAFYVVEPSVYEDMMEAAWERSIAPVLVERMQQRERAIAVDIDSL
jgi:antitoxin StbD